MEFVCANCFGFKARDKNLPDLTDAIQTLNLLYLQFKTSSREFFEEKIEKIMKEVTD